MEPTNFLDIAAAVPIYRDTAERVRDFRDVQIRPEVGNIVEQASRCMNCGIPFCHGYGCPLANRIPEINAAVKIGDFKKAYDLLSITSPMPEFTSRICPALCESACCAGLPSAPVCFKQIEYFTIENAYAKGYVRPYVPKMRSGRRVAVIGSGPSGLAAAELLNRLGHEVVVYERDRYAGGLMRYGIPDFKLEKRFVERRIDVMRASGIIFELGVRIGEDISAKYLKRNFDAVCVATGCRSPRDISVCGRDLEGIHFALDFLSSQNRLNCGETVSLDISAKGKNVLIIGGGDTGSDCMGTAFRQGAKTVTQIEIMPEPPSERHECTPWPEWEYKKRTSSSHLEGGRRLWSVTGKEFTGENGEVKRVRLGRVEWSYDAAGRPAKFVESADADFEIETDLVLLSMGFCGVKEDDIVKELALGLSKRHTISVGDCASTSSAGVFACGDAVNGPSLVVKAVASGIRTATDIDAFLRKMPI